MMGNEQSQLPGIDLEEKAVEISDFWSQHTACSYDSEQPLNISIFIGEVFVAGPLWTTYTPLEKCSKNLMIYRHPCILKYISSWKKNSKFYLAVEDIKPLSQVLSSLNTLQLCLGLHSILKALCFLHEKASASHNNVCISSIYIAKDCNWKLGGMEYLCKYNDLTWEYLAKCKSNRYDKAVDANEKGNIQKQNCNKAFIDSFAIAVLVTEVLKSASDDDIPSLSSFCDLCSSSLKQLNPSERPSLQDLLEHPFFNHEFIKIHSFLIELPLKTEEEKVIFFSSISEKIKQLNQVTVACQLGGLLLSRLVLLNKTAQTHLLPNVLCIQQDVDQVNGIFDEDTFKKYMVPRLLKIFCVHDAQIRLLLLNHFTNYVYAFSEDELQSYILPELLVGIKDTNDLLVSATLRTLSELVLILGANTVIGGKRAKLFTDGRPLPSHNRRKSKQSLSLTRIDKNVLYEPIHSFASNQRNVKVKTPLSVQTNPLPERQRPDGEEVEKSSEEVDQCPDEELDWEDWDVHENLRDNLESTQSDLDISTALIHNDQSQNIIGDESTHINLEFQEISLPKMKSRKSLPDIGELDIKNQRNIEINDEMDFFQDMEPKIEKTNKFLITHSDEGDGIRNLDKLNLIVTESDEQDGWGEEEWQ